jgi:hypothetical protein
MTSIFPFIIRRLQQPSFSDARFIFLLLPVQGTRHYARKLSAFPVQPPSVNFE